MSAKTLYNYIEAGYFKDFGVTNMTLKRIGILHKEKTAVSMSKALYNIHSSLSAEEYEKLFSLLLTDRGTEFSKPIQFEINQDTGEIKSKIFYCDPQHSSQKPHVENNYILMRDILPKKMDLSFLT